MYASQRIKVLYGPYLCCLVYVCFVGDAKNSKLELFIGNFFCYRVSVVELLKLVGATGFALIIMIDFVFDFSVV